MATSWFGGTRIIIMCNLTGPRDAQGAGKSLSKCAVRVVLEEISIWICTLSKEDDTQATWLSITQSAERLNRAKWRRKGQYSLLSELG